MPEETAAVSPRSILWPDQVVSGTYQHYSRGRFTVVRVVRNCDDDTDYVVFHREGQPEGVWFVRTLDVFTGSVQVDGRQEQRFTKVD